MMKTLSAFFNITLIVFTSPLYALEAEEIVSKALHAFYYQGGDIKTRVDMRIIDQQGRERKREFTLLRLNTEQTDSTQKYYAFFHKPSDVNKMVFMAWKNVGQSDDRWLYLPAMDLVKRIAASDDRTSFVGSHFFYEDISGRLVDEDTHILIEENDQQYIIKSIPKDPQSVEFIYNKIWVDKTSFLPMRLEYFNKNNAVYRTYQTLKVETIEGNFTVVNAEMADTQMGGKTLLSFSDVHYARGIPEKIFTERYLRKAPKKYLR